MMLIVTSLMTMVMMMSSIKMVMMTLLLLRHVAGSAPKEIDDWRYTDNGDDGVANNFADDDAVDGASCKET